MTILDIAFVAQRGSPHSVLALVLLLVKDDDFAISAFQRQPCIVAKLLQKVDVGAAVLLHTLVLRVFLCKKLGRHAVLGCHFIGNAGQLVLFPAFALLGLPDLARVGQPNGLDGDNAGRSRRNHAVQFKGSAVQCFIFAITVPVAGGDGSPDFQAFFSAAGGGAGRAAARLAGDLAGIHPAVDARCAIGVDDVVRMKRALLDDGDLGRSSLWVAICLFISGCLIVRTAKELHHIADLVAIGRCSRYIAIYHLLEPVGHPDTLTVLEFDLQVIAGVFLVVRKGQGEQVRSNAAGNIHTVKLHRTLGMAGSIFIAHVTTFFHGGRVELVLVSISGSVKTIPAGNSK